MKNVKKHLIGFNPSRPWSAEVRKARGLPPYTDKFIRAAAKKEGISANQWRFKHGITPKLKSGDVVARPAVTSTPTEIPTPPVVDPPPAAISPAVPPASDQVPSNMEGGAAPAMVEIPVQEDLSGKELTTEYAPPAVDPPPAEVAPSLGIADVGDIPVEEIFSEDEIREIMELVWEAGGSKLLALFKRKGLTEYEAQKLAKITFIIFKRRAGGKIQAAPEYFLLAYAALIFITKEKIDPPPATVKQKEIPAATEEDLKPKPLPETWNHRRSPGGDRSL